MEDSSIVLGGVVSAEATTKHPNAKNDIIWRGSSLARRSMFHFKITPTQ